MIAVVAALAPETLDLVGAALLVLSAVWGLWRGALSQLLALLTLGAAFVLAPRLAPRLERPLSQALGPPAEDLALWAWVAAWLGVLLVAGVLAQVLGALRTAPAFPRPPSRWWGALLGAAKGAVVLFVAGYAVALAAPPEPPGGALWLRLLPRARHAVGTSLGLAPAAERRLEILEERLRDGT